MATTALQPTFPAARPRRRSRLGHWVVLALLILATLFFLAPVYVMVINGLKDKSYITLAVMWKLPRDLSGGGFQLS